MSAPSAAVSFRVCCDRLGISRRTGERMLADGTFPIPELPRRKPQSPHRYSTVDIDAYLATASTSGVQRRVVGFPRTRRTRAA